MYRYIDEPYSISSTFRLSLSEVKLLEFDIISETKCGYWIKDKKGVNRYSPRYILDKKWVSKTGMKRYAYPTIEEALHNFIKRKEKQVKILSNRLSIAQSALSQGINLKEKLIEI